MAHIGQCELQTFKSEQIVGKQESFGPPDLFRKNSFLKVFWYVLMGCVISTLQLVVQVATSFITLWV